MYRLFTVQEATDIIPTVDELLGELQAAVKDLGEVREHVATVRPFSIEARNAAQEAGFLLSQIHSSKAELDRLGVHVTDVEAGVVDFPSQLGPEIVCLSWERGQDGITRYHKLGERATKPLPGKTAGSEEAGA